MSRIAYARYAAELIPHYQNAAPAGYRAFVFFTVLNRIFLCQHDKQRCTMKLLVAEVSPAASRASAHRLVKKMIEDGFCTQVNRTIVLAEKGEVNHSLIVDAATRLLKKHGWIRAPISK